MSKTLWYPFPVAKPRSWLLGNGEIVTEPALEQSGSGQKVRVVGTETSAYARDMDTMILAAVHATARAKQTYVWQPLHERAERMHNLADVDLKEQTSDLYLLRPGNSAEEKGETKLWWTFRHPEFPAIEAMLAVAAWSRHGSHTVQVKVVFPDTRTVSLMETEPVLEEYENLANAWYYRLSDPEDHEVRYWAINDPQEWSQGLVGTTTWQTDRQVVQHLLRVVDKIDALAEITVPDLRDFEALEWMALEVDQSNYNGSFRQSLTDYLSGASAMERAVQAYDDLRDVLRSVGIAMGPLSENDFQRALLEGEESAVRVEIGPVTGEEGTRVDHTLHMHLSSGTFAVTCPANHASPDEVAVEWERVKTIAQLTGQEPALLAFAQEYGRTKDEKRARRVMRERMKGARED